MSERFERVQLLMDLLDNGFSLKIANTKRRDLKCQRGHLIEKGRYIKMNTPYVEMLYCLTCGREEGWVK